MEATWSVNIPSESGEKMIEVHYCDICKFDETIDILLTSAFKYSYEPMPDTVFGALKRKGISVADLAQQPAIDLRGISGTWLSEPITGSELPIQRIGCVELLEFGTDPFLVQESLMSSLKTYFQMLDIASNHGVSMETVALPVLGGGDQDIPMELLLIPILRECISFLKRNASVKRICFIERSWMKVKAIVSVLQNSYLLLQETAAKAEGERPQATAFISYASLDKNIADNLCAKLERNHVKVWYAPRDVKGQYAEAIANAIKQATHFIVILSKNSMKSQHVLNEIDLAFQDLPDHIKFKPLRIDDTLFTPSFNYYLSRQHWLDAMIPPLEERLDDFVRDFLEDL